MRTLTEKEVVAAVDAVTVRRLRAWVRRGWIRPAEGDESPAYTELDVARARLVCQLRDELNVNDDAVPVILSLMDQLYGLRRELRHLTRAVEAQPAPVRERIRRAFREDSER